MEHIRVGDPAAAALMGYAAPIRGRVDSITRGISTPNAAASTQGLPSVDPVYTWVRLAQRVPVRIRIEAVPPGIALVAGMTATVSVGSYAESGDRLRDVFSAFVDRLGPKRPDGAAISPAGITTTVKGPHEVSTLPAPDPTKARAPTRSRRHRPRHQRGAGDRQETPAKQQRGSQRDPGTGRTARD